MDVLARCGVPEGECWVEPADLPHRHRKDGAVEKGWPVPFIPINADTNWSRLLRRLSFEAGLNGSGLARLSGFSDPQVSVWLRGLKSPNRESTIRLLDALGYELRAVRKEDL